MHKSGLIKIAIVGPESTGKSTMASQLAKELGTVCVPEYARYYCQDLANQYTLQDEINMFYGQLALEDALVPLSQHGLLVADTTVMTIKIWSDHLFGHTPHNVVQTIQERHYDYYLLMDIDLPWEDDPLRDFPEQRPHFLQIWKDELKHIKAPYALINGQGAERTQRGLQAAQRFLKGYAK